MTENARADDRRPIAGIIPHTAMVLAAGRGTRMRPLTNDRPKPLIPVDGKPLIAYTLDRFAAAGVGRAIVNVHYFAEQMEAYLSTYDRLAVTISDERGALLETGGGLVKAAAHLGRDAFFCANTDAILIDGMAGDPLVRLARQWDDARMDALLLLVPKEKASGMNSAGDLDLDADGRIAWRTGDAADYYFTGVQILSPRLLDGAPSGAFSTRLLWQKASDAGRFFGLVHDGLWMHVGDPAGLDHAEQYFASQANEKNQ